MRQQSRVIFGLPREYFTRIAREMVTRYAAVGTNGQLGVAPVWDTTSMVVLRCLAGHLPDFLKQRIEVRIWTWRLVKKPIRRHR